MLLQMQIERNRAHLIIESLTEIRSSHRLLKSCDRGINKFDMKDVQNILE